MIIRVKIYYYSVFDEGNILLEFDEGAVVKDVFEELNRIYGEEFKEEYGKPLLEALFEDFNIFLNQVFLRFPTDYDKKLMDGDRFIMTRPISGG